MSINYRQSHKEKGDDYHRIFTDDPKLRLLWQIEKRMLVRIVRRFLSSQRIDYLDFACGTGRIIAHMERYVDSALGVDVSAPMLAVARKEVVEAQLVQGDITRSEILKGDKFDLITAFRFFPNAEDELRSDVINALSDRLAPNGILVFNNHKNQSALLYRVMNVLRGESRQDRRMFHWEVERLVAQAGLIIRKMYHISILPETGRYPLRPRWLAYWIERTASCLPLRDWSLDVIYVCSKDPRRECC